MNQSAKQLRLAKQERRRRIRSSPDKRLRVVARLRLMLGAVLIVLFVLFVVLKGPTISGTYLSELAGYIVAGVTDAEDVTTIEYKSNNTSVVKAFQQGVVTVDNDELIMQNPGGVRLEQPLGYSLPTIVASERYALVYDKNGYDAALISNVTTASTQKTESAIIAACVGETGDYALITSESGYKTSITVYTSGGVQRFKWSSPDYYFTSCAISPDGSKLAVTSFGSNKDINLEGKLFLRDLNDENYIKEISLDSTVPLAVGYLNDGVVAVVGDYTTTIVSSKGKEIDKLTYADGDLKAFCFGGGALALAVRSYSGDARGELYILEENGRREQSLAIEEDLQALDYDGSRIAILTSSGLTVYNDAMRALWKNESALGAQSISLTEDGGVWLIYSKKAEHISSTSDSSEDLRK